MKTRLKQQVADSYLELILELPLRPLRGSGDHDRATEMLLHLSTLKRDQGVRDYRQVLVNLISEYETRMGFGREVQVKLSAADFVRHRIEARELTITATARQIGVSQSNLSEMLSGKRGWSKTAIRGLTKLFGIPAQRFLDD